MVLAKKYGEGVITTNPGKGGYSCKVIYIVFLYVMFIFSGVMNVFVCNCVQVNYNSLVLICTSSVSTVVVIDPIFLLFQICLVEMNSKNTLELHCHGMKHLKV